MMRIWIDQGGAYGNLGDEAMLLVAIQRLRRLFPGCEFIVPALADRPLPDIGSYERVSAPVVLTEGVRQYLDRKTRSWFGRTEQSVWANSLNLWLCDQRWWMPDYLRRVHDELVEAIDSCDFYYAVGAANLHDWSIRGNVLPRAWAVRRFAQADKPVIINGQTVGPLKTKAAGKLLRDMALSSDLFSLRDPVVSLEWMQRAGVDADRLDVIGDEAFQLDPAPAEQVDAYLMSHGIERDEPYILAHIRHTDYIKQIAADNPVLIQTLRDLAQRGKVLLCPMSYGEHSGKDEDFARLVAKQTQITDRVIPGKQIEDVQIARGLVERADSVVSLSYHLQVFAIAAARPFICLASGDYYRLKCEALQAWIDPRFRLTIDLDSDVNPGQVCGRLDEVRHGFVDHLSHVSNDIVAKQQVFASRIQKLLQVEKPGVGRAFVSEKRAA